jgi:hypothetical protein
MAKLNKAEEQIYQRQILFRYASAGKNTSRKTGNFTSKYSLSGVHSNLYETVMKIQPSEPNYSA